MSKLTAIEALDLVAKQAQWCRENGESDMRNILNFVRIIRKMADEGKTSQEIAAFLADDEDEDEDA